MSHLASRLPYSPIGITQPLIEPMIANSFPLTKGGLRGRGFSGLVSQKPQQFPD